ncbi:MAG: hypothetical protein ACXABY_33960 [Candidatus Thorarchaeota archaeon]|jgi:hypothetical protein
MIPPRYYIAPHPDPLIYFKWHCCPLPEDRAEECLCGNDLGRLWNGEKFVCMSCGIRETLEIMRGWRGGNSTDSDNRVDTSE